MVPFLAVRVQLALTLGPSNPLNPLADKTFPCCLCKNPLEIRFTKKNKPYTTCFQ